MRAQDAGQAAGTRRRPALAHGQRAGAAADSDVGQAAGTRRRPALAHGTRAGAAADSWPGLPAAPRPLAPPRRAAPEHQQHHVVRLDPQVVAQQLDALHADGVARGAGAVLARVAVPQEKAVDGVPARGRMGGWCWTMHAWCDASRCAGGWCGTWVPQTRSQAQQGRRDKMTPSNPTRDPAAAGALVDARAAAAACRRQVHARGVVDLDGRLHVPARGLQAALRHARLRARDPHKLQLPLALLPIHGAPPPLLLHSAAAV